MSAETAIGSEVLWHRLECGGYEADLALWHRLAAEAGAPVLELGAGAGRVALDLARGGFEVVAIERDATLAGELERREGEEGLGVRVVRGEARSFAEPERFGLIIAAMQLVQLLGGADGRQAMLRVARAHMRPHGRLAAAILPPGAGPAGPAGRQVPDVLEREGWIYSSLPLDVVAHEQELVIRRLRQVVSPAGDLREEVAVTRLDLLAPEALEEEATQCGLRPAGRLSIPPTAEHVGSTVVLLEAG